MDKISYSTALPFSSQVESDQPALAGIGSLSAIKILVFVFAHIPLALAMQQSSLVASVHAYLTFALGLWWLLTQEKPDKVIYVAAYITGCELLWRGTEARVFWEVGKYSVSLLLILLIFKQQLVEKTPKIWVIYFILLIPSIFAIPRIFDRMVIAYNLTGPFALAVATMYFSAQPLSREHLKRIMLAFIAPAVGLAFLSVTFTMEVESFEYVNSSTFMTTGGVGPNQYCSSLTLGSMGAFFYALNERRNRIIQLLMLTLSVWLLAQGFLTFSRGGIWTMAGAIAFYILYIVRNRRDRLNALIVSIIAVGLVSFVLFPALDKFTEGSLSRRFSNTYASGREKIALADLYMFAANPLFGVGPGQSKWQHDMFFYIKASTHTEYTRLLAEHGIFGLVALLILLGMAARRYKLLPSNELSAFRVMMTTWALLFMAHSATRMVAPSFLFGLGAIVFSDEEPLEAAGQIADSPILARPWWE